MNYLIFIILILTLVIMYFYYDYKLALVRKQLMIASKQHANIRYKQTNRNNRKINTNFSITFSSPLSKTGLLNSNSNLYLAPLKTAPTLRKTTFSMEVQILDCANSENNIWYYINLPLDSNINCRGWVSVSDFSILYSDISNLSKSH